MTDKFAQLEWRADVLQARADALTRPDADPCWDGYEQRGTKEKDGKTVPNCTKADDAKSSALRAMKEAAEDRGLNFSAKDFDVMANMKILMEAGVKALKQAGWSEDKIKSQLPTMAQEAKAYLRKRAQN